MRIHNTGDQPEHDSQ